MDELVLVWLRSEWERIPAPLPPDRQLIDESDLNDPAQNAARAELLHRDRAKILDELPDSFEAHLVDIEKDDLPKVYIVPTFDWYLDTGRTFGVVETATHLRPGRGYRLPMGTVAIEHHKRVDEIAPSFTDYDATTTDELLILIASDLAGPYTIIDGTHRAAALYRHNLTAPNTPWRAILAVADEMASSMWHIESTQAQGNIRSVEQAVTHGLIW